MDRVTAEALAKLPRYDDRMNMVSGPKITGEVRRASMDLTRRLAEMKGSR